MTAQELGSRPAMNANAIGIIGSIVDAHIAGCTEPKPCEACALDRKALDRLARLVEADYEVNQAKRRYSEVIGNNDTAKEAALMHIWHCEATATEALAAVLGEGE